jgi:hypothetical protein
MPDGSNLTTTPKQRSSLMEIEPKAHRVQALIAAIREIDDGNAAYNYRSGERESLRAALIDMAAEQADELYEMISG